MGWKFAPLRLFPRQHELALDNDCILWAMPEAIRRWLEAGAARCVLAEDVRRCFGEFSDFCGPEARNSGIRGLPPGFDLSRALSEMLAEHPCVLRSELDEQGLQVAAISRAGEPLVVRVEEVSICSPFPPHMPGLGRCGAHFVGLNARRLAWDYFDRPALECIDAHWRKHRGQVYELVGVGPTSEAPGEAML